MVLKFSRCAKFQISYISKLIAMVIYDGLLTWESSCISLRHQHSGISLNVQLYMPQLSHIIYFYWNFSLIFVVKLTMLSSPTMNACLLQTAVVPSSFSSTCLRNHYQIWSIIKVKCALAVTVNVMNGTTIWHSSTGYLTYIFQKKHQNIDLNKNMFLFVVSSDDESTSVTIMTGNKCITH